jgi:hypothetical protein
MEYIALHRVNCGTYICKASDARWNGSANEESRRGGDRRGQPTRGGATGVGIEDYGVRSWHFNTAPEECLE